MIPRVAAERPAGETAEYQDDGLGPDQLRQGDLGLAVVGLQGEVGRGLVELRARAERTDLLAKQTANQSGLRRSARARRRRPAARRRRERVLKVGERQEALAAAVAGLEERVKLLARDLAVAVAIGRENTIAPGEGASALAEKSKSAAVSDLSWSRSRRAKSASLPGNSARAIRPSPSRS